MRKLIFVALLPALAACKYTGTIAPPAATACTPYTYTATVTLPPGVTGTLTAVTGFPASLTVAPPAVGGTPTLAEVGNYVVAANGTVTSTIPWHKTNQWSASATFVVNAPAVTVNPTTGFNIPGFTQMSNPVDITITAPGPCPYTASYPAGPFGLAQITTVPSATQTSNNLNTVTITLSRQSDARYTGTLNVTLTPVGGGPAIVVPIPIVAL